MLMRLLVVFLLSVYCLLAQSPALQTINPTDLISTGPGKLNSNFSALNGAKVAKFSGSGAPGSIPLSLRGDEYLDTLNTKAYVCFSLVCSVAPNWVLNGFQTIFYQLVGSGGASQTARNRINFIAGTNITVTPADNAGTNSTDLTIAATGGGGSVFTGSTGSTVASSATPVFSLADVSVKSPITFNFTPVVNVTAPTITNKSAGAHFFIRVITDGTHTWSWNGIVADGVCPIYTDSAATTTAELLIDTDGVTVHGIDCKASIAGVVSYGVVASDPVTPSAGSSSNCGLTARGETCTTTDAAKRDTVNRAGDVATDTGLVSKLNGGTIPTGANLLGTDGSAKPVPASATNISAVQYVAGGGAAQAQTATLAPAVTALTNGLRVCWLPTAANSAAAPTLAVNGLTAKPITKLGTTALVANDITTAAVACAIYDGTEFQLQNPQTTSGGGTNAQPSWIPWGTTYGGAQMTVTHNVTYAWLLDSPRARQIAKVYLNGLGGSGAHYAWAVYPTTGCPGACSAAALATGTAQVGCGGCANSAALSYTFAADTTYYLVWSWDTDEAGVVNCTASASSQQPTTGTITPVEYGTAANATTWAAGVPTFPGTLGAITASASMCYLQIRLTY